MVYIALLVLGQLISRSCPVWLGWAILFGSASLVAANPLVRKLRSTVWRALAVVLGFVAWSAILFHVTFWIMAVVFDESL